MGARKAQAELLWGSLTEDVPSESSLLSDAGEEEH